MNEDRRTTTQEAVVGGVDTHKDAHVAAVLGGTGALLGTSEFPATLAGHADLLRWMVSFGDVSCVGVEGAGNYGAGLTRFLLAEGARVVEIVRPDRRARRFNGKSDTLDAENAARAVLAGDRTSAPKHRDGAVESLRALRVARTSATKARRAALQLLRNTIVSAPDGLRESVSGLTRTVLVRTGPVIARLLVETPLGFRGTFLAAAVVCVAAVAATLVVGVLAPDARTDVATEGAGATAVPFGAAIRRILGSEAAFSLAMILLFACLFTSMTSFQPTFADARGLDYSVFYVAYTVAVIFSRFVLAGMASRFDPRLVIAASVSVMAIAVASFLAVGSNVLAYGVSSALLGLGYGLALPSVQAQSVNVSEEAVRPRVLPIAGMLFEGTIYGFPLIAGWVISGFEYRALFTVLVAFALVQVAIAWWRYAAARKAKQKAARGRPA